MPLRIYLAGPLFSLGERHFNAKVRYSVRYVDGRGTNVNMIAEKLISELASWEAELCGDKDAAR